MQPTQTKTKWAFARVLRALAHITDITPQVGAVRFNVHGGACSGDYSPLALDVLPDGQCGGTVHMRPLYYGMLAFSEFVANHSRWVNSSLSCGGGAAGMVTEGGDEREGGEADYEDVSDVSDVSDGEGGDGDGDVSSACSNSVVHANVDDQGRLKVMLISKELRPCPTSSSSSSSLCLLQLSARLLFGSREGFGPLS